jgi:hypothetical protein
MSLVDTLRSFLIFLFFASALNVAQAENEKYGAMVALKAFQCFQFATYSKNQSEESRERLFRYGLARAREFLNHLKKHPNKEEDFYKVSPWIFGALNGPTVDFIVGRWFSYSVDDAYEKIEKSIEKDEYKRDEEFQALAARKLFFDASCDALGR